MKIGWLICTAGIFGSVREVIENSNVMIDLGADVTMYTPNGIDLGWLPYKGKHKTIEFAETDELDCLIFANIPEEPFYGIFERSKAKIKAFCQMGFPKDMLHTEPTEFLTAKHHKMIKEYWGIADGWWQVDYMKNFSNDVGPSIGGVNLDMFRPCKVEKTVDIAWSGDHRLRKGGVDVVEAIKDYSSISYFRKGIPQIEMSPFLNRAKIFVDGHYHGGWCNPVVEAMASGVPVCCTDISCTSEFAIHEVTALINEPGDTETMKKNIKRLLEDAVFAQFLADSAYEHIKQFSYKIVGERLFNAISDKL